ncbi:hypothetical protein N7471_013718 [Penicillium samsonianum]|uniref:uncharacterized protein n=1 Tax=Penicillium samsonianum TaxID=1882272 RepID=UPI0025472435|nr:uncharacterized protein N7471_013718 [Penicillium samsonianum]KAJ6118251.1 hypothetical protein N7471_013718 [Penicillium samsonianum]
MLAAKFSRSGAFVQCLFGCQYHGPSADQEKSDLIHRFQDLVQSSAVHVEILEQEDPIIPGYFGTVFMAYWRRETDYEGWWNSELVVHFWKSLPDNAGFWREKLSFPASRVLFETNKRITNGFSHVAKFEPLVEKSGYWGAYRDRIEESTPSDKLSSDIEIGIPAPTPAAEPGLRPQVRLGRTAIERFPDNICFLVEGQDHSAMEAPEKKYWFEKFEDLTNDWIVTSTTASHEEGIISARLCHSIESGPNKRLDLDMDIKSDKLPKALTLNRRVELFYFFDMSYLERISRKCNTHVALRRNFMDAYGQGGVMQDGNILLWVDVGILKGTDMEAEYIGCYEGTGFLAYWDHPGFSAN